MPHGYRRTLVVFFLSFLLAGPAVAATRPPVTYPNGMVVTAQRLASEVGAEVLRGRQRGRCGGGGRLCARRRPSLLRQYRRRRLRDAAHRRRQGHLLQLPRKGAGPAATGTCISTPTASSSPTSAPSATRRWACRGRCSASTRCAGLRHACPREALIAPAIRLAEEGFVLDQGDVDILAGSAEDLAGQANVTAIFFKDGAPLSRRASGWCRPTSRRRCRRSPRAASDAFYKGAIADRIVAASSANGGILTKKDFAELYGRRDRRRVRCSYRGYEIISAPPPSSGGTTICQILNIVEGYPMAELGFHSAQSRPL